MKAGAVVAIAALLLHALVFAFHIPGGSPPAPGASLGAGLREVVICTGQGFKRILVDESGRSVSDDNAPQTGQSQQTCPLCIALAGLGLLTVPAPEFAPPVTRAQIIAYVARLDQTIDRRPLVRRGHDPPTSA